MCHGILKTKEQEKTVAAEPAEDAEDAENAEKCYRVGQASSQDCPVRRSINHGVSMLRDQELTYRIRGCIYEVYRQLGYGFLESIYQKALVMELVQAGLEVEVERPVIVTYKGEEVGVFRLDLVVQGRVIVELKAQRQFPLGAEAQVLNYLKATNLKVGLLANFSFPKATVRRIVLENQKYPGE